MFRDIVKYCFEESLCLSCFSAEDTSQLIQSARRRLVLELPDAMLTFDFFLNLFLDVLFIFFQNFLLDALLCALLDLAPQLLFLPCTPRQLEV